MTHTFPENVALKFKGNLRWLILVGFVLLGFMVGTSPAEQGEMPDLYNALSTALFSLWFFVSFSVFLSVSRFKEKPEKPLSSFWVQVTSSSLYLKLSSSNSLLCMDRKWSKFAYYMFLSMFYGLGLFGIFAFILVMVGYSKI